MKFSSVIQRSRWRWLVLGALACFNFGSAEAQGTQAALVGVVLPSEAAPGERVSGRLVKDPAAFEHLPGLQVSRVQLNRPPDPSFSDLTIRTGEQAAGPGGAPFSLEVPPTGSPRVFVQAGKGAAHEWAPVFKAPQALPSPAFQAPPVCVAGGGQFLRGPFDGNAANTELQVDGKPAEIVAESPRGAFWLLPEGIGAGPARLEVCDNGRSAEFRVAVVALAMSAEKLKLQRGESTRFRVEVRGAETIPPEAWKTGTWPEMVDLGFVRRSVEGFEPPAGPRILLSVENASTDVVTIPDLPGERRHWLLAREDFAGGPFKYEGVIRSNRTGSFKVNGLLVPFLYPLEAPAGACAGGGEGPPVGLAGGGTIEIDDGAPHELHHCQGGRMIVVLGSERDRTINATLAAVAGLNSGSHALKVWFRSNPQGEPSVENPFVPDASGNWARFKVPDPGKPGSEKEGRTGQLAQGLCCIDELMVIFHGHQTGGWKQLMKGLPDLLGDRPVRKVVVWSCRSSESFFPHSIQFPRKRYEKFCYLVGPRPCPCGCDPAACRGRDADDRPSVCPTADSPVTILTAAYWTDPKDVKRATRLGLNPGAPPAGLFTTPADGKLREITVTTSGAITARVVDAPSTIFGSAGIARDPALETPNGEKFDESKHLDPSQVLEPSGDKGDATDPGTWQRESNTAWQARFAGGGTRYPGPPCCDRREGCVPDAPAH